MIKTRNPKIYMLFKTRYKEYTFYFTSNERNAQQNRHKQVIKDIIQFNAQLTAPLGLT